MQYWLVKSEPSTYSWQDLLDEGVTCWDGVRNHQAKKHLASMKVGDQVLFYHSVKDKEVVGICEVTREGYPDPTDDTGKWVVVDVKPVKTLDKSVTLAEIKATPELAEVALVRQGRLSVMPLEKKEFELILTL